MAGPRGSGKTTLLKMLQQPAIEAWKHPEADRYRALVDFTGVFVPTDISWGAQLQALGYGRLDPDSHGVLSVAAFTTHTLRSLITAMLYRLAKTKDDSLVPFRRVQLDSDAEGSLVREVSSAWHLSPTIPSLLSLKQSLTRKLSEIQELATKLSFTAESQRKEEVAATRALHLHFIPAVVLAIEIFNDAVGENDGTWALLFDELEIAPSWIQEELIRSLRSVDQRILFKLAMSPLSDNAFYIRDAFSGLPGQDFEQVALWYTEKRDSYSFCERLWYSIVRNDEAKPKDVLGKSYFETGVEEWAGSGTAYRPDSRLGRLFKNLAKTDKPFRAYLREKEIDPLKLEQLQPDERAATVRKVAPLVPVREFYRSPDPTETAASRQKRRSRKSPVLYAGAESLFAITEGNPRWFIAVVRRMLARCTPGCRRVSPSIQADELAIAGQRFTALLSTLPVPPSLTRSPRGLLHLLNQVGDFFHEKIVGDVFLADPPGTFIVDSTATNELADAIKQAVNAGALIYLPDDEAQVILKSSRGKRFRVSYLLAPHYGLPLRLGPSVSLSTILKGKRGEGEIPLPFEGDADESHNGDAH